jgi:hypothetical protein
MNRWIPMVWIGLSPEVPGYLVEKISQTWFEGRQQRSHERLSFSPPRK